MTKKAANAAMRKKYGLLWFERSGAKKERNALSGRTTSGRAAAKTRKAGQWVIPFGDVAKVGARAQKIYRQWDGQGHRFAAYGPVKSVVVSPEEGVPASEGYVYKISGTRKDGFHSTPGTGGSFPTISGLLEEIQRDAIESRDFSAKELREQFDLAGILPNPRRHR